VEKPIDFAESRAAVYFGLPLLFWIWGFFQVEVQNIAEMQVL
jgi:hypothetical protein